MPATTRASTRASVNNNAAASSSIQPSAKAMSKRPAVGQVQTEKAAKASKTRPASLIKANDDDDFIDIEDILNDSGVVVDDGDEYVDIDVLLAGSDAVNGDLVNTSDAVEHDFINDSDAGDGDFVDDSGVGNDDSIDNLDVVNDDWEQDYDDSDVVQTIEEEELEAFEGSIDDPSSDEDSEPVRRTTRSTTKTNASKGKASTSKKSKNKHGPETVAEAMLYQWQHVTWTYVGSTALRSSRLSPDSDRHATFKGRFRHSISVRKGQAMQFDWSKPLEGCHFTKGMLSVWQRLDPEVLLHWLMSNVHPAVVEACGQSIRTGKEYLEIPPVSNAELCLWGIYIFIILDAAGNVIFIYIGSGTGVLGVFQRVWSYDKFLASAILRGSTRARDGTHVVEACGQNRTLHIRRVFGVSRNTCSAPRMLLVEGLCTDVFNALDVTSPTGGRYRTEASIKAYPAAVPEDMRAVPYKPLNRAHQFQQGARHVTPACSMIGKGCTQATKATMVMFVEDGGNLRYGCNHCYIGWWSWEKRHPFLSIEDRISTWEEHKSLQEKTDFYKPIPKGTLCTVCNEPANARIFFGDVGSESSCAAHYQQWSSAGWKDKVSEDQEGDLARWMEVFDEFLVHNAALAENKRVRRDLAELECKFCKTSFAIADLQDVPERMRKAFNVPFDDSVPAICYKCNSKWQESTRKGRTPFTAFSDFSAECVRSRIALNREDLARETPCICGAKSAGTPPPGFEFEEEYPGFCRACRQWTHAQMKKGVSWDTVDDFYDAMMARKRHAD